MKYIVCYFDPKATKIFVEKKNEAGESFVALSSPYNFVFRDEIVARVVNADDEEQARQKLDKGYSYCNIIPHRTIKAGDGIYFDQFANAYRASEYGFVVFDGNQGKLKLLPPLTINKDKTKAHIIIFPTKFLKLPTYKDIEEMLQKRQIITIVEKSEIEAKLAEINVNNPKVVRIEVARGKEPENGYDEYYIPLLNIEKKAGKMLQDGRIDFKEVGSIIEVTKDQEILRRIPKEKPIDGYTIFGDKIEAIVEKREGYEVGENVVRSRYDENIFVAAINGCLNVDGKRIGVSPEAIIRGNVDYESGNVEFSGTVHVKESVLPGFSVKAGGNIVIDGTANDAILVADGDIIVKQGITGKGDGKVIAKGKVKTNYILNTVVEAEKEVEVEDSIINSTVFSNDKVIVSGRHGKIVGGTITARHEIIVNTVGSSQGTPTVLHVGKSLLVERELITIKKEMDVYRTNVDEIIKKIKASFGEKLFENPKEFVASLPPVKKKNCLLLLRDLSENNKKLKELVEKWKAVEEKNKFEREPTIIIADTVYPGTEINVKKRRRFIDQVLKNVKFYENPADKLISFTSAV
ncbi:MAG: FapA family protein [Spirochaetes bacterium]|nr:FapA family protein [Spirochaetota bacterium]